MLVTVKNNIDSISQTLLLQQEDTLLSLGKELDKLFTRLVTLPSIEPHHFGEAVQHLIGIHVKNIAEYRHRQVWIKGENAVEETVDYVKMLIDMPVWNKHYLSFIDVSQTNAPFSMCRDRAKPLAELLVKHSGVEGLTVQIASDDIVYHQLGIDSFSEAIQNISEKYPIGI